MGPLRRSRVEYVDWCVNWRRGCGHGCAYCYAAAMAHRFGRTPAGGWRASELAFTEPGRALGEQLERKRAAVEGMILVSSSHDPFMPGPWERQMEGRRVVMELGTAGLWPQTMVLTKSPERALKALNGLGAGPDGLWFGTSLTALSSELTARYEPGAEGPVERLRGIRDALLWGYKTWVSLEPPLPGALLVGLVTAVRAALIVQPWVVLGKMNYRGKADERLRKWSQSGHWGLDRDQAVQDLVELMGYEESIRPRAWGYWVKKELRVWGERGEIASSLRSSQ